MGFVAYGYHVINQFHKYGDVSSESKDPQY